MRDSELTKYERTKHINKTESWRDRNDCDGDLHFFPSHAAALTPCNTSSAVQNKQTMYTFSFNNFAISIVGKRFIIFAQF